MGLLGFGLVKCMGVVVVGVGGTFVYCGTL